MNPLKILVIEDDAQVRQFLTERLAREGYEVQAAANGQAGLQLSEAYIFETALIDIQLGDMTGIEVLEAIKRRDTDVDIVIMTGNPEVDTAVQALRLGAYDYLVKPLQWTELKFLLDRIVERRYLRAEVTSLRTRLGETASSGELIGASPLLEKVRDTITKVAPTDTIVLIQGESGTGKERVASAIHQLSLRNKGPFVPINCAAIPSELIESELFGHQKGAFSGATTDSRGLFRSAEKGTLLLDEVGELPLQLQPKLLRVLQEKEVRPVGGSQVHKVDVRVIAATNQNLEAAVQAGKFRQDLFFRLNVVRIEPPPLRKMKETIPALVMHFIRTLNHRFARQVLSVTPEAMSALRAYDFPGNVRELQNILERAYALGANGQIGAADLPSLGTHTAHSQTRTLEDLERELISETLHLHGGDKEKTAGALEMSQRTLYRRLRKLGLQ
jgi:DNA-binding NtrC family response regulator